MNRIEQELERQNETAANEQAPGQVGKIAQQYTLESERLLGLLLKLDFEESHFVTCDPWKRNCGGVPRGSFVLFKIDPRSVDAEDRSFCTRLILARVTNSAPTPVEANVQQTLFQVHKLQAQLDPLTHRELQWGALKASIIGTFYDDEIEGGCQIGFGNDVDTFFSPFAYVAYMPTDADLSVLINSFVRSESPVTIGNLRYTETPSPGILLDIPILIDPRDIVGEPTAAQRLANFGKTRFGKSNSNKIISQAIFDSGLDVAQVFFDPSGEYTYVNDQDGTSLYAMHHTRSVRYSLTPRVLRADERELGLSQAIHLSVNFYEFASVGHSLIVSLWDTENSSLPGYMRPILDWSPLDRSEAPDREQRSAFNHYWRTMGMWYALLHRADYDAPNILAPIDFRANVKNDLIDTVPGIRRTPDNRFAEDGQPISVLRELYRRVATLHGQHGNARGWFENSQDGSPYFNDVETNLLRALSEDNLTAHNYLRPFSQYHSARGIFSFRRNCERCASRQIRVY